MIGSAIGRVISVMKGKDVLFMSTTDEWETPDDIYQDLHKEFLFTLDPCCMSKNQKCVNGMGLDAAMERQDPCDIFLHLHCDGLTADWSMENCFVNPPHSTIGKWVKKSYDESRYEGTSVVMLIPARTDTTWWHNYVMKAEEIWFVNKRVCFIGWIKKPGQKDVPDEEAEYVLGSAPSTFPSVIVVFDYRLKKACRDVNGEGQCCPFIRTYIQPKNRGKV